MTSFAMVLLAVAACVAAATSLWMALHIVWRQRQAEERKASVLRAQFLAHFRVLQDSIVPRGRPLDPLQKEVYEPLQYLWARADVLQAEEVEAIHYCSSTLLALRHKSSVNQTQARLAHKLIDDTCAVLHRYEQMADQPDPSRSLMPSFMRRLPALTFSMTGRPPRQVPATPRDVGVLKTST